jgi:polysaccharide export outer membrane protein
MFHRQKAMRLNFLCHYPSFMLHVLLVGGVLCSCTSRYTAPRSEVIKDAQKSGVTILSVEEDTERFFSFERKAEEKLISVLELRSGQDQDPNYLIGGGDTLEVAVFDVEELNLTRQVSRSGLMALPLIGAVQVQGRTVAEVEEDIAKRLTKFVRQPQVSVYVTDYGSQMVSVIGAVVQPGSYPLQKGSNNILELLSRAGGLAPDAGGYITFIPAEMSGLAESRSPADKARYAIESMKQDSQLPETGVEIPLQRVMGTDGGIPIEVPVRGGDMIVIAQSGQVMVDGEVQKRGSYDLGSRMTVLGALAAAGGITYAAKVDEIEVIRNVNEEGPARLVINLEDFLQGQSNDVLLRDGDVIRVPSDSARRVTQNTFEGLSRVINFGVGGNFNVAN